MRRLPSLFAALAVTAAFLPARPLADRGAFSVEGGAVISAARVSPAVGTGDSVFGTLGGAILGARYAVRNDLELTAGGTWLNPVAFYHQAVTIPCSGSACIGTLSSKMGRTTLAVGADYVRGLAFRFHVGAELGWARVVFTDLTHSSGAPLASSRDVNGLLLAPRVGFEWVVTDHVAFALTPRVDLLIGEPQLAFSVPLTVSYSWYR